MAVWQINTKVKKSVRIKQKILRYSDPRLAKSKQQNEEAEGSRADERLEMSKELADVLPKEKT